MAEIYSLLGDPVPTEIERKYLIKMPNIDELCNIYNVTKVNIIQTYLNSTSDVERRVRQRGSEGVYSYYYTQKRGSGLSRIEIEKKDKQRRLFELSYGCKYFFTPNSKR